MTAGAFLALAALFDGGHTQAISSQADDAMDGATLPFAVFSVFYAVTFVL